MAYKDSTSDTKQVMPLLYPFTLYVIVNDTRVAVVIVNANTMIDALNIAKNSVAFMPTDNLLPTIMLEGNN